MIAIYVVPLDLSLDLRAPLERLLNLNEREKALRFAYPQLSDRYIVAHGVLRLLLSAHIGIQPFTIGFDTVGRGKPIVIGCQSASNIDFSLTHSGGLACVAVSTSGPVGVDVETDRPLWDPHLLKSILSPAELEELDALPSRILETEIGLRCWTLKEAVLKAAGHGLYVSPTEVVLGPGDLPNLLSGRIASAIARCPGEPNPNLRTVAVTRWAVRPLDLPDAFGAVAWRSEASDIRPELRALTAEDLRDRLLRLDSYPTNDA